MARSAPRPWHRHTLGFLALIAVLLLAGIAPAEARPRTTGCDAAKQLQVRGAEMQRVRCLADLTTTGLLKEGNEAGEMYTDFAGYFGLHALETVNPTGAPGVQIDGYFPDTPPTGTLFGQPYVPNTYHGWNHDAQFVIRLPDNWNGKLMITGAPGTRRQYAMDFILSDWAMKQGYAFASTDKGNQGGFFALDGDEPGDAIAEWNRRVEELTVVAKRVVRDYYRANPSYTYIAGISNSGYLVRHALENNQQHYDGGVDWEGVLFHPDYSFFNYLPTALKYYPIYADPNASEADRQAARAALIDAGFDPESEFMWQYHYEIYWFATQLGFRLEFDPMYLGAEADYDLFSRPQAVRDAIAKVGLTGKIKRPMITLHGDRDALLPVSTDSDIYARLVRESQRERLHRYYVVEGGTHVDMLYRVNNYVALFGNNPALADPRYSTELRPILPCFHAALEALETWVEQKPAHRNEPPASGLIPMTSGGNPLYDCSLNAVPR
jgi:hypothetical protein